MDSDVGRTIQAAIYRAGSFGHRPRVPTDGTRLEEAARRRMTERGFAYVAGSAGAESTARANLAAFDRHRVLPRMLTGPTGRDLGVDLLGRRHALPMLLSPVGVLSAAHDDADVAAARAARAAGVTPVLSTQADRPMEEVAAALDGSPFWYQLYWSRDDDLAASLVARAESCGAEAVVVTLDTTYLGWRPRDLDLGHLPFARGEGIAQYTSDPVFRRLVADRVAAQTGGDAEPQPRPTPAAVRTLLAMSRNHPGSTRDNVRSPLPRAAVETFLDVFSNPALTWEDLPRLRDMTSLPVIVKGVLAPDDATRALEAGVDGIWVSNHGGRQVDRSVAALDALPAVVEAVRDAGSDAPVLFDSGVRTGADAFVALALGADAVGIGRPYVYGLALDGERGATEVLRHLTAELDLTMALTGCRTLAEVTGSRLA